MVVLAVVFGLAALTLAALARWGPGPDPRDRRDLLAAAGLAFFGALLAAFSADS